MEPRFASRPRMPARALSTATGWVKPRWPCWTSVGMRIAARAAGSVPRTKAVPARMGAAHEGREAPGV